MDTVSRLLCTQGRWLARSRGRRRRSWPRCQEAELLALLFFQKRKWVSESLVYNASEICAIFILWFQRIRMEPHSGPLHNRAGGQQGKHGVVLLAEAEIQQSESCLTSQRSRDPHSPLLQPQRGHPSAQTQTQTQTQKAVFSALYKTRRFG